MFSSDAGCSAASPNGVELHQGHIIMKAQARGISQMDSPVSFRWLLSISKSRVHDVKSANGYVNGTLKISAQCSEQIAQGGVLNSELPFVQDSPQLFLQDAGLRFRRH